MLTRDSQDVLMQLALDLPVCLDRAVYRAALLNLENEKLVDLHGDNNFGAITRHGRDAVRVLLSKRLTHYDD